MTKTYITKSPEETEKLGEKLSAGAKAGDVFCLSGDLGTGKTAFAKGFARGLGIKDHITSPTFTIINQYEGRLPLYHFDVYRLENEDELLGIGADEFFYGEGVCLIEWAELVKGAVPEGAVWIKIEKDLEKNESFRKIEVIA